MDSDGVAKEIDAQVHARSRKYRRRNARTGSGARADAAGGEFVRIVGVTLEVQPLDIGRAG